MCIIVYKPQGVVAPSWATLQRCFDANPNGAGFMVAENGSVQIKKGFMTWRAFKHAVKPYKARTDLPLVMHFRITTHGGTSQEMTHPFPLSSKDKDLKSLEKRCPVGIAHNGVIPLCYSAKELSDTAQFIKQYSKFFIDSPKWYETEEKVSLLEACIDSRMCILSNDGHAEIIGSGWVKDDGIYYSNKSYQPKTYEAFKSYNYYSIPFEDDFLDARLEPQEEFTPYDCDILNGESYDYDRCGLCEYYADCWNI